METTENFSQNSRPRRRRARKLANRENQLIQMAYDLAEERLMNKTASAQEIVHFLKMGTAKTQLEKRKLETETALLESKKSAVDATKRSEEKYQEAITAIRTYQGTNDADDEVF